jgi:plasmid replication initiation protein
MSRVLTIRDSKGWTKYNVFSRCRYRREEGILELGFHPDLKPHYLNLQGLFTEYNLLDYLLLPSIYSQRIFEILSSWADKPYVEISLHDLHNMLDTPASLRADFRNFRIRVLEKAHKDITGKTKSLYYNWEPIKNGRSVIAIKFHFSRGKFLVSPKKQKDTDAKEMISNNKAFQSAVSCAKMKGERCDDPNNRPRVCKVCREYVLI